MMRRVMARAMGILAVAALLAGCSPRSGELVLISPDPAPTLPTAQEDASGYMSHRTYSRQVAGAEGGVDAQRDVLGWRGMDELLCVESPLRVSDQMPAGDTVYSVDFATGFTRAIEWPKELEESSFEVHDISPDGNNILLVLHYVDGSKGLTIFSVARGTFFEVDVMADMSDMLAFGWGTGLFGYIAQHDQAPQPVLRIVSTSDGEVVVERSTDFLMEYLGDSEPYFMNRGRVMDIMGSDDFFILLKNGILGRCYPRSGRADVARDFGNRMPYAYKVMRGGAVVYSNATGIWWGQEGNETPVPIATDSDFFAVSQDEKQVAYMRNATQGQDIFVVDLHQNMVYTRSRVYDALDTVYNYLQWSPDGKKLLIAYYSKGQKNDVPESPPPYWVFDFS